ncbi:MAG: SAM-dependent methyltransferase [Ruminococcaceae bacterium]|nr:SAM-dependent methyltransferase [Oscillospiraceae bacterium]
MNPSSDTSAPRLFEDERLDEINENLSLIQKKNGLTFGTDAYLLAAFARKTPSARAVDLGSGTGIIPLLLLSKNKIASGVAVEIQPAFVDLIERNAAINELGNRITPLCADIRTLSASTLGREVDLVTANPPYMRTDSGKRNVHDEKYVARHEVCGGIEDFCAAAARLLKHGGRFLTVWRPDRLSELFYALHEAKLAPKRMTVVYADTESEPCMVLTEAVKGASPAMRVTPPLILYQKSKGANEKTRRLSENAQAIYDTCSFPNRFYQ